jgi:hypothetical protein
MMYLLEPPKTVILFGHVWLRLSLLIFVAPLSESTAPGSRFIDCRLATRCSRYADVIARKSFAPNESLLARIHKGERGTGKFVVNS